MGMRAFTQVEQLRNLRGYAEYDRPNNKLYEFTGNLVLQGAQGAMVCHECGRARGVVRDARALKPQRKGQPA